MSQTDAKYLTSPKQRYARATKKERSQILDEYVQTTGYHRKHAIVILTGKYKWVARPIHRPRRTIYTAEVKIISRFSDVSTMDFDKGAFQSWGEFVCHCERPQGAKQYHRCMEIASRAFGPLAMTLPCKRAHSSPRN